MAAIANEKVRSMLARDLGQEEAQKQSASSVLSQMVQTRDP